MTSHRSRFLASLSERLHSDLASREREREEADALAWPETAGQGEAPWPEEIPGDGVDRAAPSGAAPVEAHPAARSETGAAPGATSGIDPMVRREAAPAAPPVVPWSEAGMPDRLREAIASVRRVAHELHEPPADDYPMHRPAPFGDADDRPMRRPARFGDDAGYEVSLSHDDAAYQEPPRGERIAPLDDHARFEDGWTGAGEDDAFEQRPAGDGFALLDEGARFRHQEPPLDEDAGREQWRADDQAAVHHDGDLGDQDRARFDVRARHDGWSPEHVPAALDDDPEREQDDPAFRHEGTAPHRHASGDEPAPLDQAAYASWDLDDGAGQSAASGGREGAHDRLPLWRRAKRRYGLHAAAFAVAIAFVALAGFGLGMLSGDGGEVGGALTREGLRAAAPTEAAPLPTERETPPAERAPAAELSELVTVHVAPAPGAAVAQPAPPARLTLSPPPLPSPPKPAFRPSAASDATPSDAAPTDAATSEPAPSDREVAAALEDAAAVLREADEGEGTGGPFQPLFTKLPTAQPTETRVFVHYSAGAVGAPATAMHLVRHLKARGFAAEARPVEFAIPRNSIRYFFDDDRAQAEALRDSLAGQVPGGAAPSVMDFTTYEPRPRPGLIEVWLRA